MQPSVEANQIAAQISQLDTKSTTTLRRVRSAASKRLRPETGQGVLEIAEHLVGSYRWVAYELIYHHPAALELVDEEIALRLARDFSDWGAVDAFSRYISGSGVASSSARRRPHHLVGDVSGSMVATGRSGVYRAAQPTRSRRNG